MATQMTSSYDMRLLILSVIIAILAAYTSLDLAGQLSTSNGKAKLVWLVGGAVAMGTGIWSMHFVGMLAFCLPIPVKYDELTVLLSILSAILASAFALFILSQEIVNTHKLLLGSLMMGSGITTMHYTGMAAMRLPATIHYNYLLVGLSVAIAFFVSLVALWLTFHINSSNSNYLRWQKIGGAILMGAAIPTMHYTGMAATSFHLTSTTQTIAYSHLDSANLSTTISIVTFSILGLALLISLETKVSEQTATLIKLEHEIIERQKIEDRLQAQTKQLEQALAVLKQAQTHLVQSEKMSGLGQIVAGVAHEINNPTTFIQGNLRYAIEYTQSLVGLIKLYQQEYPSPNPAIQVEIQAIDLDYLVEDLKNIFQSMQVGCKRINEIVLSLRNFSRLDEAVLKLVNIHEGIDSTLMILSHRLKAQAQRPEIKIIKEYSQLPPVECYAGPLNQVFINILNNAIDALEDSYHQQMQELSVKETAQILVTHHQIPSNWSKKSNENLPWPNLEIHISTQLIDHDWIAISIIDNGKGMNEDVRAKLFDPFFTTKPVGKGTGLGLSISYQVVVEKHGGKLECFSAPEEGAEFVITIPRSQHLVNG
ncbi:MAG TPA: MHYT domain-containing protein [Nostocaceae cyanobacterium]|nr:MHYT domain-containing protein [Nostocaceae cyanobacterium]